MKTARRHRERSEAIQRFDLPHPYPPRGAGREAAGGVAHAMGARLMELLVTRAAQGAKNRPPVVASPRFTCPNAYRFPPRLAGRVRVGPSQRTIP
jgi:hypothetical protein